MAQPYDHERRSQAAKKGWETRRKNQEEKEKNERQQINFDENNVDTNDNNNYGDSDSGVDVTDDIQIILDTVEEYINRIIYDTIRDYMLNRFHQIIEDEGADMVAFRLDRKEPILLAKIENMNYEMRYADQLAEAVMTFFSFITPNNTDEDKYMLTGMAYEYIPKISRGHASWYKRYKYGD